MAVISKKEADAYDRMLDAADRIAELIRSGGFSLEEDELEELCIFLARNGPKVREMLRQARLTWP